MSGKRAHQGVGATEEGIARARAARPAERCQAVRERVRRTIDENPAGRVAAA